MLMDLRNINKLEELKKSMMKSEVEERIGVKDIESKMNMNIHSNPNKTEVSMNVNYKNNREKIEVSRGDILYVELDKTSVGSEQHGIRYAVCLQNDIGNKYSPTIIVALMTSQLYKSQLPTHVSLQGGMYGLPKDSIVLLEQIRTLDKRRIIKKVGSLDEIMMKRVDTAIDISMKNLKPKTALERLPRAVQDEISETLQYIYSYEKVLGRSNSDNLNHLISERSMLLEHLEKICNDNKINYKDYYIPYTKERKVVMI